MCNAFSCIIGRDKKVTWKFGIDSHETLIQKAGYTDNTLDPDLIQFARIEISPKNKDYINPDEWIFKIDMDVTPKWWTLEHKIACLEAHKKWMNKLDKIVIRKPFVNPFMDVIPPDEITEGHLVLLREWDSARASVCDSVRTSVCDSVRTSVWASVRASVGASVRASVWRTVRDSVWASVWASVRDSVGDSVGDSVRDSVWRTVRDSVWDSVRASVRDSVGDSVWAYYGSFFNLPRDAWNHTEHIKTEDYPFRSAVELWELGLVPSFDGKILRLHGGKDAKVLWSGKV